MATRSDVLENFRNYSRNTTKTVYPLSSTGRESHEARLNQTLNELNLQVERESVALNDLKSRNGSLDTFEDLSLGSQVQLRRLRVITDMYASITPAEPSLPSPYSSLPSLLALRSTHRLVSETADSIPVTHKALAGARLCLAKEQSDLADAALLTQALDDRIEALRVATTEKSQKSPDDAARALLDAEEIRRKTYSREIKQTMRSLVKFTNNTLAPMLAAEELGGPVAGSKLDITVETLAAGFNSKGMSKRSKTAVSEDMRQRRIDQIWGPQGDDGRDFEVQPRSEAEAAAEEMKTLTEDLLNTVTEGSTGAWVSLDRESAAARFLVRSGVAVLHRMNARRIRLLDFGRDVDD